MAKQSTRQEIRRAAYSKAVRVILAERHHASAGRCCDQCHCVALANAVSALDALAKGKAASGA